uniref:Uncharacterized protein n=1 Tax=Oryza nivara TaxID=4536 RepID=A0A0E0GQ52_ORYNI
MAVGTPAPGTPPRGRRPPPSNLRPAAAQRRSPASPRHPALPGRHGHGRGAASTGELALLGPAGEALITVRSSRVEAASRPARIGACRSTDEDATAGEGVDWEEEPLGFEVSTTPIPELPDPEMTTGRPPPVSSPRRRVEPPPRPRRGAQRPSLLPTPTSPPSRASDTVGCLPIRRPTTSCLALHRRCSPVVPQPMPLQSDTARVGAPAVSTAPSTRRRRARPSPLMCARAWEKGGRSERKKLKERAIGTFFLPGPTCQSCQTDEP